MSATRRRAESLADAAPGATLRPMKTLAAAAALLLAVPAAAQQATLRDPLLDRLGGR